MSKHKKVVDKKAKVGKAGSPPSGTENEKARSEKEDRARMPKVSKKETGKDDSGGGALH